MKGQHKPECQCGFCVQKRVNIAKKKTPAAQPAQPAPVVTDQEEPKTAPPSQAGEKPSGDDSKPASPVNSPTPAASVGPSAGQPAKPPATMRQKIAAQKATVKSDTAAQPAPAQPAAKNWFQKLFSGWGTVLDLD